MADSKSGVYARYLGKEYHARNNHDGTVDLLTADPAEQANGFKLNITGSYSRTILRSVVQELYLISPRAIYKGVEVAVLRLEDGIVHIGLCNTPPDDGWDQRGRGEYIKILPFAELDRYWLDLKYL